MLLGCWAAGLLIYGYATRAFSSRALERATYDSVAFRFIAGNEHPDHDTIAHFRKRFIQHIQPLFVEVPKVARAMGMLKMGTVAVDGTKAHANPTFPPQRACPTDMRASSRSA
ncbi:MAG: transposase [Steroidobacteraceae bacterium]